MREQSWTGEWFCDNAVRQKDGSLKLSGECTETCQYYAMFCGVAPRADYPMLWDRMIRDFGPGRDAKKTFPQIAPSNFIFGRCIRDELLSEVGERRRIYDEMCRHFLGMAEKTGTLWEKIMFLDHDGLPSNLTFPKPSLDLSVSPHFKNRGQIFRGSRNPQ